MKELLSTIFTTSKERIANPIIGTFIISWTAFNWKPIAFILFSNKKIEDKIVYIDSNFANIGNLLIFPLITVVIYLLIIPYINLLFEYLLEFPRVKRNMISISKQKQLINNEKQLAIEEIKLEEAKIEFRERKNHNALVESLQKQIIEKDNQIIEEIEKSENLLADARKQVQRTNKQIEELSNSTTQQINSYVEENRILKENIVEKDKYLSDLKQKQRIRELEMENRHNAVQQENIHLSTEFNDLKRELSQSYNNIYAIENSRKNNR
ncbi:hypothetical protein [Sphingobacterium tabacisoli]|uniref:Chromosome partition protein Smc n=1 Tax=Sphingobacterium tabacisoli TaxID=2044855 RepID=A0ABW5L2K8_9SPHI|nr:hypothetical protein [Sphingobacterium tabacisoli]